MAGIPASDSTDVVQDALATATSQLKRGLFRRASSLKTWVYTILRGKIFDYQKSAYHRYLGKAIPLDPGVDLAPIEAQPHEGISKELQLATRQAVAALPPRERLVLVLKEVEGYTVPEISTRLRWREREVERVLARAREMLRQILLGAPLGRRSTNR
jgi:RNA polymerase sigma factor (sigma-70 family)